MSGSERRKVASVVVSEQPPPSQPPSPWARGGTGDARDEVIFGRPDRGSGSSGSGPRRGSEPLTRGGGAPDGDRFGAGAVTGSEPIVINLDRDPEPVVDPVLARRRTMRYFAGTAGAVVVVGIVVILALTLTGNSPLHTNTAAPPPDTRSQLAKLCPPPSGGASKRQAVPPTPSGPRTNDPDSGISYRAFGAPWQPWNQDWSDAGDDLAVNYRVGQFFVTEEYPGGDYLATILSASVPATTNDALAIDLKCTGTQVAADARTAFYPHPNTMDSIRDEQMNLGGLPAWVSEFRLHFHETGLKATSELVLLATIDVGRPSAAILYVSIPGTHSQYDYVIDQLLASVRPTA
jgi:hypothetical protein